MCAVAQLRRALRWAARTWFDHAMAPFVTGLRAGAIGPSDFGLPA